MKLVSKKSGDEECGAVFRFWKGSKHNTVEETALSVVLIGEGYRRAHAKHLLKHPLAGRVKVVGELASGRRVELISELEPEAVILDCASEGINPLAVLPRLAAIGGSLRVVALVDGSAAPEERALLDLGADAVADIQDPHALARAVGPHDPLGDHSPEDTRRDKILATAA